MLLYRYFLPILLLLGMSVAGLLGWAHARTRGERTSAEVQCAQLVRQLGLTDLALWSEARYTRHPSQADLFTPFQEFPGSFDHFPAGSLISPPPLNLETTVKVLRKESRP